jgi:hypothetical protein
VKDERVARRGQHARDRRPVTDVATDLRADAGRYDERNVESLAIDDLPLAKTEDRFRR